MELGEVDRRLAELDYTPLTSALAGRCLYEFVLRSGIEDILELGFAHGTSTVYMAAALQQQGAGTVTTIDHASALELEPTIEDLVRHLGLEARVDPILAERSYTWELLRMLERQSTDDDTTPCFDFCFVDGAHTWDTDGLAFFLVDKLLRPDRWLLFDDLHWSHAKSPRVKAKRLRSVPREELETQQMTKVFDLLVRQHPSYDRFHVVAGYGWAYKRAEGDATHEEDVDRILGPELLHELAFGLLNHTADQSDTQ